MDAVQTIALSMGTAWASGINLYAAVCMLGLLGMTGNIVLPPELHLLSNPIVVAAAGIMFVVEFFMDKIPGVDSAWDALHTFVRIPAGAILAAGAVGQVDGGVQLAAALLGGTLAAGTHATKAGTRLLINTSPEPVSNWTASFAEDIAVFAGLWAALHHPYLFLGLLLLFIALLFMFLPILWRGVKSIVNWFRVRLGGGKGDTASRDARNLPVTAPDSPHT